MERERPEQGVGVGAKPVLEKLERGDDRRPIARDCCLIGVNHDRASAENFSLYLRDILLAPPPEPAVF